MSNERSPRPVCSTTMGISGDMHASLRYSATFWLPIIGLLPQTRNP